MRLNAGIAAADFNSKVFSQKAECQREGRVPDGVVSPMQGSLYSAAFDKAGSKHRCPGEKSRHAAGLNHHHYDLHYGTLPSNPTNPKT